MPLYLTRFSYTPETWARLIGNPEDRGKAAQSYIESVGGKLHGFWYAFGEHDAYTLWEAPDNASMAAVALAITAGGALSSLENDSAPDRRRDDGCSAEGPASRVPSARRVALARVGRCDARLHVAGRDSSTVCDEVDRPGRRYYIEAKARAPRRRARLSSWTTSRRLA